MLPIGMASAADLRDPADKQFLVWPNIPVIKATDFDEYASDRKIFANLHEAKGDPAALVAALQAVDNLQMHHERSAMSALGRSLNVQVIGELDRLVRNINTRTPRLKFEFADITPVELQRQGALDVAALEALKAKARRLDLVAYLTYSQLGGSFVQVTGTLVKLSNGDTQSFTVTGPVTQVAASMALEWFNYFYGNRFAPHKNPMPDREWLNAAPTHINQLVSLEVARRYCASQNAELPSAEELEMGETSGIYHGGIELKPDALYHMRSGMYYSAEPVYVQNKIKPNLNKDGSNAYYYCIRKKAGGKKVTGR
ncbi:MAG: hypothetical protein PHU77_12520 [Simplicispira sp.]|nr:hypothetical protein [Simplicispira sp.]